MSVGFFAGGWDLLHPGHLAALEFAADKCDYLIVGLNCNPDKANTIESIYERYKRLDSIKWVDKIIPYQNDNDLIYNMLPTLDFDIYFCGEDHKGNLKQEKLLLELGKEIIYLPRKHNLSSSNLKERIIECVENKKLMKNL